MFCFLERPSLFSAFDFVPGLFPRDQVSLDKSAGFLWLFQKEGSNFEIFLPFWDCQKKSIGKDAGRVGISPEHHLNFLKKMPLRLPACLSPAPSGKNLGSFSSNIGPLTNFQNFQPMRRTRPPSGIGGRFGEMEMRFIYLVNDQQH